MKKKVWNITVKDNPNRVIMGENDEFYTTDTEAYLVFELEDENFNPATAVLTLENRNDGSLKNEKVDVVDGLIEWEMPQRYIEHFGNWQGQLVYEDTKDGQPELYTSATFSFVVNAHIGDKKKPSLVEIENWEKFIRDGTELIETWEDMEALREENERQRVESEARRQDSENNRTEAEAFRAGNEQTRIDSEARREVTFKDSLVTWDGRYESAEVERDEQYTTAESDRDEQYQGAESERESTFEENEQVRVSAESVRVANEEERISKDSERDSKIEAVEGLQADLISGAVDSAAVQQHVEQRYGELEEEYAPKLTDVTAQLAQKANQTDLEIERARISNLTANAGDTDGNAELLDIRVGFDGITYPTAGEATRALSNYMKTTNESWVVLND